MWRHDLRHALVTLLLGVGLALTPLAGQQDPSPTASREEILERLLELAREMRRLEAELPPEALEELHRRLAEIDAAEAPEEAPSEPPAPAAAVEPDPPGPPEPTGAPVETESALAAPVAPAEPPADVAVPQEAPATGTGCNTLIALDTNGDGQISGADRYWRYLRLWVDRNRDGSMDSREVFHPFDLDVVQIEAGLRYFLTARESNGDIYREDHLSLVPLGKRAETGVLMVDASRIQRGDGLTFLSAEGETLEGLQTFRAGLRVRTADGVVTALNCPG